MAVNNQDNGDTIVMMVSIGDRAHLTDHTFPRLVAWASAHGYSSMLIKEPIISNSTLAPHFNKLIAHRAAPGFKRYIIIDDDLMLKETAPAMEPVPEGFVGLCEDAVQTNTRAAHVNWTGNTGFIVADVKALAILEEAYANGEYPYHWGDNDKGIWGPYDQAALNNVAFERERAYKLDWRWNYQAIISFYKDGKGWDHWRKNRWYRMWYYLCAISPVKNKYNKMTKEAYAIHMTMGAYPRFFSIIHR